MNNRNMITALKDLFGEIEGVVRVHYEGDDSEPKAYRSLDDALEDVADAATTGGYTAAQMEAMTYIVSEAAYQEQEAEYRSMRSDDEMMK